MPYTYKLQKHPDTGKTLPVILRKEDYSFIPTVEDNTDYKEYLKWVDEGNTAEAAD